MRRSHRSAYRSCTSILRSPGCKRAVLRTYEAQYSLGDWVRLIIISRILLHPVSSRYAMARREHFTKNFNCKSTFQTGSSNILQKESDPYFGGGFYQISRLKPRVLKLLSLFF